MSNTSESDLVSVRSAGSLTSGIPRISSRNKVNMKRWLAAPLNGNIFFKSKICVGEFYETVFPTMLQSQESMQSDTLMELPVGTACRVLQLGANERAEVLTSNTQGWIHCIGKGHEKVLEKYNRDVDSAVSQIQVGDKYEIQVQVTVRASQALDSEAKAILNPGAVITIRQLGTFNKRRAKVTARAMKHLGVEGWVSIVSRQGEVLIGLCTEKSKPGLGVEFFPKFARVNDFLDAAVTGNLASMRGVAESSGIDLNCTDVRGMTALMHAASLVNYAIVEYLIHRRDAINVEALDAGGKNVVHHASKRPKSRHTPQHDRMQVTIVKLLIEAKAPFDTRDSNGCTPLMLSISHNDEVVLQELISAKASVTMQDFEGRSPLDYARSFGHPRLLKMLRDAGAVGESDEGETTTIVLADEAVDEETPKSTRAKPTSGESSDESDNCADSDNEAVD
jgi:hypothetical protein